MSLVRVSYSEYEGEARSWSIRNVHFQKINLIVAKNATGKSRVLSVIFSIAAVISGKRSSGFESGNFEIELLLNEKQYVYVIKFSKNVVVEESLHIDGDEMLSRNQDGLGRIYYETSKSFLEFKVPIESVAALGRRDEIQHPYLIDLYNWAASVVHYQFGSDFGRSRVLNNLEVSSLFDPSTSQALVEDPNNLVAAYSLGYSKFGDSFDQAIIDDMKELGYVLSQVGSGDLHEQTQFPLRVFGMFATERELGFPNAQLNMSQGMFRALALTIHINISVFSKLSKVILIDDIGEGLDYERSSSVISLIINKAEANNFQVLMTTNDRFVMNTVPLNYWTVLIRNQGTVRAINEQNSPEVFEEFKFIGLSNFNFFSSNYFKQAEKFL